MTNFPGPYEIRLNYSVVSAFTRQHQMRLSLKMNTPADPGDPFADWETLSRNAANPTLDTVVTALEAVLDDLFYTTTTFNDVELWEYDPASFNATYRATYVIGTNGVGAGSSQADQQSIYTFRTTTGGIAKVDLRETISTPGNRVAYASVSAAHQALMDHITNAGMPYVGRDNGWIFAPLFFLPGTNEALWKEHYNH